MPKQKECECFPLYCRQDREKRSHSSLDTPASKVAREEYKIFPFQKNEFMYMQMRKDKNGSMTAMDHLFVGEICPREREYFIFPQLCIQQAEKQTAALTETTARSLFTSGSQSGGFPPLQILR